MMNKKMLAAAVAATLAAPGMAMAQDEGAGPIDWDFYGSLRIQYEAADPKGESSYDGFRDAYSRVGFTANMPLNDGLSAFAQLEMPLDLANGRVQDPFNGGRNNDAAEELGRKGEDVRIGKVGLESDVAGTFAYGRDWMPYYNAIAFPVDMFSSFQSGFATYTTFRESDSVFYYSPDFNGFSFGAAYSANSGADDSSGSPDDRYQLTGSYTIEDTTLSLGVDDLDGENNDRIWGFSAMHGMGDLSLSAKVEYRESDGDVDGDVAANVYAAYDWGQHTFKGMLANVDNYGEDIVHLGYDFNVNDALKFFAEYYYEEEATGAIPEERARDTGSEFVGWGPYDDDGNPNGSNDVFMVGMHYSF